MPTWNDHHYARAQEFTRLLAEALSAAKSPESLSASAPALELTTAPFLRPAPLTAAPPSPTAAPPPATPPPSAPPAPAPAAGPSASSVFKKIPWKK